MHRKIYFLSIFSISFLLIILFYSFGIISTTKRKISIDYSHQQYQKSQEQTLFEKKLEQNNDEVVIFSKFQFLNITRKVIFKQIYFIFSSKFFF